MKHSNLNSIQERKEIKKSRLSRRNRTIAAILCAMICYTSVMANAISIEVAPVAPQNPTPPSQQGSFDIGIEVAPQVPQQPQAPAQPQVPQQPAQPEQKPEQKPETPAQPQTPQQPAQPEQKPQQPQVPAQPAQKPETPAQPAQKPEQPQTPQQPEQKPETPAQPQAPAQPEQKPETPQQPEEKPETPTQSEQSGSESDNNSLPSSYELKGFELDTSKAWSLPLIQFDNYSLRNFEEYSHIVLNKLAGSNGSFDMGTLTDSAGNEIKTEIS